MITVSLQNLAFRTNTDFNLECTDITFRSGDRVAVVGRNGSGKTTLIESILGLRSNVEIEAKTMDCEVGLLKENKGNVLAKIGYLSANNFYPSGVKVSDIIGLHRTLYDRSDQDLYDILGLDLIKRNQYSNCSVGEKRRADLYFACAHHPSLLVMDEFTSGLDKHYMREFFSWLTASYLPPGNQATVIFASHSENELEIANKVLWIESGGVGFCGDKSRFIQDEIGGYRLQMEISAGAVDIPARANVLIRKENSPTSTGYLIYGGPELREYAAAKLESDEALMEASVRKTRDADILEYVANYDASIRGATR